MVSKRLLFYICFLAITILFLGCGNSVVTNKDKKSDLKPLFTMPSIPMMISNVENRREYLAQHYWDNFDFENIAHLENDSLMGCVITGYVQVLNMNPKSVIESSVNNMLERSLKLGYNTFEMVTSRFEDYLYDPNSPMRDEELYIYVLRYTVDVAELEDIYKIRSRNQLDMVLKNRVGHQSVNFEYESRDGSVSTLYTVKSPHTLLFFNTPDCEDCARVKDHIANSSLLAKMVKSEKITILAVYTEQDIDMWRAADYPSIILNTADVDGVINRDKLYDLKALPSLYLLDESKTVLLKDRSIEEIEKYLMQ